MRKYIYSIASTTSGEKTGELEIEAVNADEAWQKKNQVEKSGKLLKSDECIYEWKEIVDIPSGVKRR